ncbi:fibrinogen-like YCDxxxxGGGW domain-containing protein [Chryseobacterium sp. OV279]|uniref:fibrinogen-like YCDxxxxGGGW domain-containing protein n=1 Tax=Chryseobacterium sp. OV279 TaxID=1500285 RepID=UPI00091C57E6|nr:fibrinogen-like YCDxxxxGGGW domain-containing protein [Chryseobacterium sp. OV279]SHF41013.1 hypothetical protein SAMN02787100_1914 [Chryseobacterium sp. OV279]
MKKKLFFPFLMVCSNLFFGQVGINTSTPKATLDIVANTNNSPIGVLPPRLSGDQLQGMDSYYNDDQKGAIVFVTDAVSSPSPKTKNISTAGYYYYDAILSQWIALGSGSEPWKNTDGQGAVSNTEPIYHMGQVSIGSSLADTNAVLDISSNAKGILLPRMSSSNRNAISTPAANGLLIYNTTTNCLNYFDGNASKWLSLCGSFEPATFGLLDCSSPTGPSGTYTQGTILDAVNNTYTIKVNVTSVGNYQILATTGNGYSFSKSGTFTETGIFDVVLAGQGSPITGPSNNSPSITFNGVNVAPACTLPVIHVNGSTTLFSINCSGSTVHGIYRQGIALDATNYIDIPVTGVTTPGNIIVETSLINGVKFSSGTIAIGASTNSIRLYGQGTPAIVANNSSYSFTIPGSVTCTFTINVITSVGTFVNPADRCYQILQLNPAAADGEYFIKGLNGTATKTYCDMTNGGYTLIQSYSEKAAFVDDTNFLINNSQNLNVNDNRNYTAATGLSGIVTYKNYLLPVAVRQNIRSNATKNQYRVRIVNDVANVANNTDSWANNNYVVIDFNIPTSGAYDMIGGIFADFPYVKVSGKIFGKNYSMDGTINGNYVSFDGQAWNYARLYNAGYAKVISHQNAPPSYAFSYTASNGATINTNLTALDDIWGNYGDSTFNHHIGKCGNAASDDYAGVTECVGTGRAPHSFNNGEGRYVQWFVK